MARIPRGAIRGSQKHDFWWYIWELRSKPRLGAKSHRHRVTGSQAVWDPMWRREGQCVVWGSERRRQTRKGIVKIYYSVSVGKEMRRERVLRLRTFSIYMQRKGCWNAKSPCLGLIIHDPLITWLNAQHLPLNYSSSFSHTSLPPSGQSLKATTDNLLCVLMYLISCVVFLRLGLNSPVSRLYKVLHNRS